MVMKTMATFVKWLRVVVMMVKELAGSLLIKVLTGLELTLQQTFLLRQILLG